MRAELTAELDTDRYTNKSSPRTGFESRGGIPRIGRRIHQMCIYSGLTSCDIGEAAECLSKIFDVIGTFWVFDRHVIHVDLYGFADLLIEDFIKEPLVGCFGVLQPKKHDLVAIDPSLDDERSFRLVILVH
ncbi:hypothetical protein L3X38_036854 [Prunus dulcis]|uniref:Uncharacterized protein n=1 Tax=Prunus dulcis TaxID=3755 RepID=A0AAD4V4B1_PRUDU|nr:hypothetical protein L3X38_036854 [Prunus dulcis]